MCTLVNYKVRLCCCAQILDMQVFIRKFTFPSLDFITCQLHRPHYVLIRQLAYDSLFIPTSLRRWWRLE